MNVVQEQKTQYIQIRPPNCFSCNSMMLEAANLGFKKQEEGSYKGKVIGRYVYLCGNVLTNCRNEGLHLYSAYFSSNQHNVTLNFLGVLGDPNLEKKVGKLNLPEHPLRRAQFIFRDTRKQIYVRQEMSLWLTNRLKYPNFTAPAPNTKQDKQNRQQQSFVAPAPAQPAPPQQPVIQQSQTSPATMPQSGTTVQYHFHGVGGGQNFGLDGSQFSGVHQIYSAEVAMDAGLFAPSFLQQHGRLPTIEELQQRYRLHQQSAAALHSSLSSRLQPQLQQMQGMMQNEEEKKLFDKYVSRIAKMAYFHTHGVFNFTQEAAAMFVANELGGLNQKIFQTAFHYIMTNPGMHDELLERVRKWHQSYTQPQVHSPQQTVHVPVPHNRNGRFASLRNMPVWARGLIAVAVLLIAIASFVGMYARSRSLANGNITSQEQTTAQNPAEQPLDMTSLSEPSPEAADAMSGQYVCWIEWTNVANEPYLFDQIHIDSQLATPGIVPSGANREQIRQALTNDKNRAHITAFWEHVIGSVPADPDMSCGADMANANAQHHVCVETAGGQQMQLVLTMEQLEPLDGICPGQEVPLDDTLIERLPTTANAIVGGQ